MTPPAETARKTPLETWEVFLYGYYAFLKSEMWLKSRANSGVDIKSRRK